MPCQSRPGGRGNVSRVSTIAVALAACAVTAQPALAGGFLVARFGAEHGHVTADNPTALYYNPGALTLVDGTSLYLDGTLAWRSMVYDRDPAAIDNPLGAGERAAGTPVELVYANSGEGRLSAVAAAPFIGAVSNLGIDGLALGIGFYVPFGGGATWDQVEPVEGHPGVVDGPQRWWAIAGSVRTSYITAAGAYRIPDLRLSLGFGLNLTYSIVHTTRARNASGHDHMVDINGNLQEGRALVDAAGWEPALGLGVMWEPQPDRLWIGLSYQSQPNFGQSELDGSALIVQALAKPQASTVKLFHEYPDVWRFGLRWRPSPQSEIRFETTLQNWSVLDTQCVIDVDADQKCDGSTAVVALLPRYWEDTVGVRLGGSYWPSEDLETIFGLGFDENAVPDHTLEPGLYDADKITATIGTRIGLLDDALGLTLMYTQVLNFPRTIAPRGRVADGAAVGGGDAVTQTDVSAVGLERIERNPDAAGRYESTTGAFNVSLEYRF